MLYEVITPLGHPAAAAHLAVGEVEEEGCFAVDGDVEVVGVVLAVFEGDEAVEGDVLEDGPVLHHLGVEEQAVSSEAVDMAVDGRRGDAQIAGDLAVAGAAIDLGGQLLDDVGAFGPVGDAEGLPTEGDAAVQALKPADTLGVGLAPVVAEVSPLPSLVQGSYNFV